MKERAGTLIRHWLVPAFAVATLFPRLLSIPGVPDQVQLTEIVFLISLLFLWRETLKEVVRLPYLSLIVGGYVIVNIVSAILSGEFSSVLEALGRGYLGVLLFVAAAYVRRAGRQQVYSLWMWATTGVSIVAVICYAIALLDLPFAGMWVSKIPDYPYFGDLFRLRGSGQTYGMFFMLLLPGYFIAVQHWRKGEGDWWPILVIGTAALLTFGKEILLIPVGHILLVNGPAIWQKTLAAGLVVVLLLATHFLLINKNSEVNATAYVSREVTEIGDSRIMETNYTENKRAAMTIFSRNPVWGVGPGQFARSTVQLVEEGRYPDKFGRFDPHSAWTGALAETGSIGFLFLCLIVGYLFWMRDPKPDEVAVLLILFLIASVFKDIMNFRALWLLMGLFVGTYAHGNPSKMNQITLPSHKI